MTKPILSIIIPMRGGVPRSWLDELLKVRGNVEFILVYPPGVCKFESEDTRLHQITTTVQGELNQRITALLNSTGIYVLSINCDEYLHPDIVEIAQDYFTEFPKSYFVRLRSRLFDFGDPNIIQSWEDFPKISTLKVKRAKFSKNDPIPEEQKNLSREEKSKMLREIPISPLENQFNIKVLWKGRKDHKGSHQENFDKKIWRNELVQENLKEVVETFKILGPFKYIPFWTADRLLGLSMQAKFYESQKIIGHWLPTPEQFRTEDNPPQYPRKHRRYVLAELLLLRNYPNYGYFWNLVLSKGDLFSIFVPVDTIKDWAKKYGIMEEKQ